MGPIRWSVADQEHFRRIYEGKPASFRLAKRKSKNTEPPCQINRLVNCGTANEKGRYLLKQGPNSSEIYTVGKIRYISSKTGEPYENLDCRLLPYKDSAEGLRLILFFHGSPNLIDLAKNKTSGTFRGELPKAKSTSVYMGIPTDFLDFKSAQKCDWLDPEVLRFHPFPEAENALYTGTHSSYTHYYRIEPTDNVSFSLRLSDKKLISRREIKIFLTAFTFAGLITISSTLFTYTEKESIVHYISIEIIIVFFAFAFLIQLWTGWFADSLQRYLYPCIFRFVRFIKRKWKLILCILLGAAFIPYVIKVFWHWKEGSLVPWNPFDAWKDIMDSLRSIWNSRLQS
ncbi:MAG: hypothetical protein ACFFCW_35120 [Candidatus Hodarchaeota archaeon]